MDLEHPENGIVHIIGPELGLTQPGILLSVETVIHRLMVPLVQLHLELVQVKLNMYLQRRPYGKVSQKR